MPACGCRLVATSRPTCTSSPAPAVRVLLQRRCVFVDFAEASAAARAMRALHGKALPQLSGGEEMTCSELLALHGRAAFQHDSPCCLGPALWQQLCFTMWLGGTQRQGHHQV